MCPQCKNTEYNKGPVHKSPSKSPFRNSSPLTLKGPFTKSPVKTKHHQGSSPSPQTKSSSSLPEKRQLFGISDKGFDDSDDFTDIWEFKDETSEAERIPNKRMHSDSYEECSTSPKKKLAKVDESRIPKEKTKNALREGKGSLIYVTV